MERDEDPPAPEVWTTYGVTGAGSVAANVDTGVQYNHPALVNKYRRATWAVGCSITTTTGTTQPPARSALIPTYRAMTMVTVPRMGTEVGDDGGTNQVGVAPGASGLPPTAAALIMRRCSRRSNSWWRPPTWLATIPIQASALTPSINHGAGLAAARFSRA